MNKLLALLRRELLSLFRDRYVIFSIIVAPFLSMLLIGGITVAMLAGVEDNGNSLPELSLCVQDAGDEVARELASRLGARMSCEGRYVLTLREGFGERLRTGERAEAVVLVSTDNPLSLPDQTAVAAISSALQAASLQLAIERGWTTPPPKVSVELQKKYLVKGKVMEEGEALAVASLQYAVALLFLILHFITIQVGAISVGIDKEARIAESVFTYPLRRRDLVLAKAAGVIATSIVALTSFTAGLAFVYAFLLAHVEVGGRSAAEEVSRILAEASFGAPQLLISFAAFLFLALSSSLLGTFFGYLFASDIRGALVTSSYVGLITAAPALLDIMLLSASTPLFYLFPIYPPLQSSKLSLYGAYGEGLLSLLLAALYAAVLFLLNAWIARPSVVLYGLGSMLRRRLY